MAVAVLVRDEAAEGLEKSDGVDTPRRLARKVAVLEIEDEGVPVLV